MVFKAGVACVCEAIITAGRVSILELKSVSDTVNSGPEDVRIFSGAGIVSVWNKGGFDVEDEVVGLIAVGLIVFVNVLYVKKKKYQ